MSRGKARRSLELIEASIEILREIQPASAYQTAVNAKTVAEAFEPNRRRLHLSWAHHQEVAARPAAEQDALLERWTVCLSKGGLGL